jgi:hypothetical protein
MLCLLHVFPSLLFSYKALMNFTKEDARTQFMRILRTLPYGNATFFAVKRIEDPIGLLPPRLILGINKRGVHFFRPVPKEYLHSAELRDIMQVRVCVYMCRVAFELGTGISSHRLIAFMHQPGVHCKEEAHP